MTIRTLSKPRMRLCLVKISKSNNDTSRLEVKRHISFADQKVKINFDLTMGSVALRNATNGAFQPAKPVPK